MRCHHRQHERGTLSAPRSLVRPKQASGVAQLARAHVNIVRYFFRVPTFWTKRHREAPGENTNHREREEPRGRKSGAEPLCDRHMPLTAHGLPWTEMDAIVERRWPKNPCLFFHGSSKARSRSKPAIRQALGREPGRDRLQDHPERECDGIEDRGGFQRCGCQLSSREETRSEGKIHTQR